VHLPWGVRWTLCGLVAQDGGMPIASLTADLEQCTCHLCHEALELGYKP
jgi:hypothetical protein